MPAGVLPRLLAFLPDPEPGGASPPGRREGVEATVSLDIFRADRRGVLRGVAEPERGDLAGDLPLPLPFPGVVAGVVSRDEASRELRRGVSAVYSSSSSSSSPSLEASLACVSLPSRSLVCVLVDLALPGADCAAAEAALRGVVLREEAAGRFAGDEAAPATTCAAGPSCEKGKQRVLC